MNIINAIIFIQFPLVPHPPCRVKRVWSVNKQSAHRFYRLLWLAISYLMLFYVSVHWSTCTAAVGCVLWLVLGPRYITKHTNAWYIATRHHWSCDLWSWSCEREIRLEIVSHDKIVWAERSDSISHFFVWLSSVLTLSYMCPVSHWLSTLSGELLSAVLFIMHYLSFSPHISNCKHLHAHCTNTYMYVTST